MIPAFRFLLPWLFREAKAPGRLDFPKTDEVKSRCGDEPNLKMRPSGPGF
jgi:hypothetical protein